MNDKSKIIIFESGKEEGIFSLNRKFYPSYFTDNDIRKQFNEVKEKAGRRFSFDDKKIIQINQKTENNNIVYEDGKYHIITEEDLKEQDYWDSPIECDIMVITEKYKGIVVGHKMADCPILIIEDRKQGVTALSHCGVSYIDRSLPLQTLNVLIEKYNSNIEDLYVYIGSCAKKETYIYDKYPKWANNDNIWKNNIIKEEDGYHIDMIGAIKVQLKQIDDKKIYVSPIDTVLDENYYSHIASSKGNKEKLGQNFVGFYYY